MTRRLLSTAQLADKLGYVKDDGQGGVTPNLEMFYRNRRALERQGLPAPAIGRGRGQRWDEQAVDLWLDARMPADLRRRRDAPEDTDWAGELARRAQALAGG